MDNERRCEVCGGPMDGKRTDSTVCSGACRAKRTRTGQISARETSARASARTLSKHEIEGFGTQGCQCRMCLGSADPSAINHGPYLTASELEAEGYKRNRASLPGDLDYTGVADKFQVIAVV
jgi:hypothetical protein